VALKTAGLLSLMFQTGLPVPAEEAVLPVFRGIFIDIGDRQSIPDGLSTFSARLKNISGIVAALEPPALVLLDEIGSGTDPEDGVALAIAVVDHLRTRGALVLATTHLEALKAYAATTEGCANCATQFDEATCTPLYRLIAGIPGRSGGLEIAERLGLQADILEAARGRRGQSGERVASYLARLQRLTSDLEARLRDARSENERLARERASLETEFQERETRRQKAVVAEIEHALRSMREEGERYLESIKDRALRVAMRRQETKLAGALRSRARSLLLAAEGAPAPPSTTPIVPGTHVVVERLGVRGVVESIRDDRVVVLVRGKRMTAALREVRPESGGNTAGGGAPTLPQGVTLKRKPESGTADEIHLLGRTVEDALELVDKYLDDVYLEGRSPVRLVHGVGSGRLKKAIAGLLSKHPHVEGFASAPADQGGAGVTIVTLRL
jgi:DNA mismatch repair protein MutS2